MMTATILQQASEHYNSSNRSNGYQGKCSTNHPSDNPCTIDMNFEQMLFAMTGHKARRTEANKRSKARRAKR